MDLLGSAVAVSFVPSAQPPKNAAAAPAPWQSCRHGFFLVESAFSDPRTPAKLKPQSSSPIPQPLNRGISESSCQLSVNNP